MWRQRSSGSGGSNSPTESARLSSDLYAKGDSNSLEDRGPCMMKQRLTTIPLLTGSLGASG